MEDYRVQLDFYDGPMDLLLHLVRREEVDIHDIPIARITEQYCRYVQMLHALDIELAGEFVLMAAWLMEIKTRMLLPAGPPPTADGQASSDQAAAEALADPRAELVRQLLAYKQFRDLADELGQAAAAQSLKYPRAGLDWKELAGEEADEELDLADVQIWDLFDAFGRLMDATGQVASHHVHYDETPIHELAEDLVERLTSSGPLRFEQLFEGLGRVEIIGLFLALLELVRQKRVECRQEHPFGAILLSLRAPGEVPPAETPPPPPDPQAVADKPARRGRSAPDESFGVTWLDAEDEETGDPVLHLIDQDLKSIFIPADPDTGAAASPPAEAAPSQSGSVTPSVRPIDSPPADP